MVLTLQPARARLEFDAERYSIQDLLSAIRSAGPQYDGRLVLKCAGPEADLSRALGAVEGVRNPGMQGADGVRLLTFLPDKRTMYGSLVKAASAVAAAVGPPPPK